MRFCFRESVGIFMPARHCITFPTPLSWSLLSISTVSRLCSLTCAPWIASGCLKKSKMNFPASFPLRWAQLVPNRPFMHPRWGSTPSNQTKWIGCACSRCSIRHRHFYGSRAKTVCLKKTCNARLRRRSRRAKTSRPRSTTFPARSAASTTSESCSKALSKASPAAPAFRGFPSSPLPRRRSTHSVPALNACRKPARLSSKKTIPLCSGFRCMRTVFPAPCFVISNP